MKTFKSFVLFTVLGGIIISLAFLFIQQDQRKVVIAKAILPAFRNVEGIGTVLPAFPGAEGFGTETPGGRFGRIVIVTNLYDTTDVSSRDYVGSFRWALEHTWSDDPNDPYDQRRIVIFKVGGTIKLVDKLIITQPFVTIAGQTAPGDGITLRGDELTIATHDVVVRGVRVRVGDEGSPTCCRDGINVGTTHADSDVYNVVIDHSSVSWAIDENMSTWASGPKPYVTQDVTIQWSIISEGLNNSIHVDEDAPTPTTTDPHSMGAIIGQDGHNMTLHHNLFAHNRGRNPRISGIVNSEIVNNVIYDWGYGAVEFSGDKNVAHVLNNYFKTSINSESAEISINKSISALSEIYERCNFVLDKNISAQPFAARISSPEYFKFSPNQIFTPSGVTISHTLVAYEDVLNFAGVISPVRDDVDKRVVNNVREWTGDIIDSQNQVGGWPDYQGGEYATDVDNDGIPDAWELAHDIDPNDASDASSYIIRAPSGYTWIEAYVNSLIPQPERSTPSPKGLCPTYFTGPY